MFGCKEVIPPEMRDVDDFWKKSQDNKSFLSRVKKRIQYWFAVGPLGRHWHCKARRYPTDIIKFKGKGEWRPEQHRDPGHPTKRAWTSRIQIWSRFSFVIKYPYFITGHIFWREKDIVPVGEYQSNFGILKYFSFYIGWGRDDKPMYYPKIYAGGNAE